MSDIGEKRSESVVESEDTLQTKDEPPPPVIGERFVPSYLRFDDWCARGRDVFL